MGQRADLTKKRSRSAHEEETEEKRYKLKCVPIERDIQLVKSKLSAGLPVVVGMHWHTEKNRSGTIVLSSEPSTGVRRSSRHNKKKQGKEKEEEEVVGKHCLLLTGYLDEEGAEGGGWLQCLNSHGEGWGAKGRGRMSYGAFMSLFIDGFVPLPG